MVLVNIRHFLYTNSIYVPYNIVAISIYIPYNYYIMYIILIIHVAHKIYRTFGN